MRRFDPRWLMAALSTPLLLAPAPAAAQRDTPPEPAVWLESGPELAPGQTARLGYEVPSRGYLTILRATTDGDLSVVYPQSPNNRSSRVARGAIPMRADAAPGVGYLFWVTSPVPFDFREYSARGGQWATAGVGRRGGDPFEQVDRFARGTTRGRYTVGYSRYRVGITGRAGERRAPAVHGSGYGDSYDGGYAGYPGGSYPDDGYASDGYGYGDYSGYWGGPQWNGYAQDTYRYRRSWRDREYERAYDRAADNDPRSRYLRHCADGTLAPYTVPCGATAQPQRPGPRGSRRP